MKEKKNQQKIRKTNRNSNLNNVNCRNKGKWANESVNTRFSPLSRACPCIGYVALSDRSRTRKTKSSQISAEGKQKNKTKNPNQTFGRVQT